jgi:arsenite transporter
MNFFEKYLSVWVFACIVIGILLGQFFPTIFSVISQLEYAHVNIPIGVLIWVMIIPMLMKIDFSSLGQIRSFWRGMGVTLVVNWLVKPFSMALLAWFFIQQVGIHYLPAQNIDQYVAGLILLAAAPCTAMVFVWSRLTQGNPLFTLSQVALNDMIMLFAFGPIVGFLLGVASIHVPVGTLLTSVVMYILVPLIIAQMLRAHLTKQGEAHFNHLMHRIGGASMLALLATLVLLFAFQGTQIVQQPLIIFILAIPIIIQVFLNAGLAYYLNRILGERHDVACPSALIGASNFFELAVAVAISLFGIHSGAALATVVGVLVEVPLMLIVVRFVNQSQAWYCKYSLHRE